MHNELWSFLQAYFPPTYLLAHVLDYCREHKQETIHVGIDPLFWINHSSAVKGADNAPLRLIFLRCNLLLRLPITPLFVFPGASVSQSKQLDEELKPKLIELLNAFGFQWHQAGVEHDVSTELARLQLSGVLDAILTDDFDVLLRGVQHVIRNSSATHPHEKPHEKKNKVFMSKDGPPQPANLFLLALCCGHKAWGSQAFAESLIGLQRSEETRAQIAATILHSDMTLHADNLFTAAQHPSILSSKFIADWLKEFQSRLQLDPPMRFPDVNTFPNKDVLRHLVAVSSNVNLADGSDEFVWQNNQPSVYLMAAYVGKHFSWSLQRLESYIPKTLFPSFVLRVLQQQRNDIPLSFLREAPIALDATDGPLDLKATTGPLVLAFSGSSRMEANLEAEVLEYSVEGDSRIFRRLVEFGFKLGREARANNTEEEDGGKVIDLEDIDDGGTGGPSDAITSDQENHRIRVWVPAVYVENGCPEIILAFTRSAQERKSRDQNDTELKRRRREEKEAGKKKPDSEKRKRKERDEPTTPKSSPKKHKASKKSQGADIREFLSSPSKPHAGPSNT